MSNIKQIKKLERRIDKLIQKLDHIHKEINCLHEKSKTKPLRKKQYWHLERLYKVQDYYLKEIHQMTVEIISIKCEMEKGYSSETNPLQSKIDNTE